MASPVLQIRVPEELLSWIQERAQSDHIEPSQFARRLLIEAQLQDAAKPLIDVEGSPGAEGLRAAAPNGAPLKSATELESESPPVVTAPKRIRGRKLVEPTPAEKTAWLEAPIPCQCGGKIYQVGRLKGKCSNCSRPRAL